MSVQSRVARGAAWLDERAPGWELKIGLGTLEMSSCVNCVLGQVFGDFCDVYDSVLDDAEIESMGFESIEQYGRGRVASDYKVLREEWTRVVKDRLNAGVVL